MAEIILTNIPVSAKIMNLYLTFNVPSYTVSPTPTQPNKRTGNLLNC